MKRLIKKVVPKGVLILIRKIIGVHGIQRVNLVKTIYYNFYLFPFRIAIKLPLFIFFGVKVYDIGSIVIEGEVKTGMFRLGKINRKSRTNTFKFINSGVIRIGGTVYLEAGIILENFGEIIFEGETQCGEDVTFLIREKLFVGKYTRIGFKCFFMDSDDHFMMNIMTGEVKKNKKGIGIGSNCWIGNSTVIKKGVILPDYTIVASNSLLLKDYTGIISSHSIIGGTPAKFLVNGYRRIYNRKEEARLNNLFGNRRELSAVKIDLSDIDLDKYFTQDALWN